MLAPELRIWLQPVPDAAFREPLAEQFWPESVPESVWQALVRKPEAERLILLRTSSTENFSVG